MKSMALISIINKNTHTICVLFYDFFNQLVRRSFTKSL